MTSMGDAEAGLEQINRQVTQQVTLTVGVSDGSQRSGERNLDHSWYYNEQDFSLSLEMTVIGRLLGALIMSFPHFGIMPYRNVFTGIGGGVSSQLVIQDHLLGG